jgi:hypothetical protein
MRRRPRASCGRSTALAALVEAHPGRPTVPLPSADRVVWLCWLALRGHRRGLAPGPNVPSHPTRKEVIRVSAQLIAAVVIFAGFVAVFLADPTGTRSANRGSATVVDQLERRLDKRERELDERERRLEHDA